MNILSIDFGTKNIGLAWCDTGINVVLPYGKLAVENLQSIVKKLADLIKQERIQKVVVGLPLGMGGEENMNTKRIREFGENLKSLINADLEFFDERFSSQQADRTAGGASRDEKSAMAILESYLAKNK